MKTNRVLSLIFFGVSLLGMPLFFTNAKVIAQQTTAEDYENLTDNDNKTIIQSLGTGLEAFKNLNLSFTGDTTDNAFVRIVQCDDNLYNIDETCTNKIEYDPLSQFNTTPVQTTYEYTFSTLIHAPTKYFFIFISVSDTENILVWGDAFNAYNNGTCRKTVGVANWQNCSTLQDIFFRLTIAEQIEFFVPNTTGQLENNFPYWGLKITDSPSTTTSKGVIINYGQGGTNQYKDQASTTLAGTSFNVDVLKNTSLGTNSYTATAHWYVGNKEYSSTTVNFTISTSTFTADYYPQPQIPGSTTTISNLSANCDPASNVFTQGFCYLFYYLLVPDGNVLTKFSDYASTTLPTKFPYSLVKDGKVIISELRPTASSTNIKITAFNTLLATTGIQVFNSATLTNSTLLQTTFTYFKYLAWIIIGLYSITKIIKLF